MYCEDVWAAIRSAKRAEERRIDRAIAAMVSGIEGKRKMVWLCRQKSVEAVKAVKNDRKATFKERANE